MTGTEIEYMAIWENCMNLDGEKNNIKEFYSVGRDRLSGNYVMAVDDSMGNQMYFIIDREQYDLFDKDIQALNKLNEEFRKAGVSHNAFWFSNWERFNNTNEQNQLMVRYMLRELEYEKQKRKND